MHQMKTHCEEGETNRLVRDLVPDLTKVLRLFKSSLTMLHRHSKFSQVEQQQDFDQIIEQQRQLIEKYYEVSKNLIQSFKMEFQRLFCRIIETVQNPNKTTCLQGYLEQVESIIYCAICHRDPDYILALSDIFAKGKEIYQTMVTPSKALQKSVLLKDTHVVISVERRQSAMLKGKKQGREPLGLTKLLVEMELDQSYIRDWFLYVPGHRQFSLQDMIGKNKSIALQINSYKKLYSESRSKQLKRPTPKARRIFPFFSHPMSVSQARITPILPTSKHLTEETQEDEDVIVRHRDTSNTEAQKLYTFCGQNQKGGTSQRKTSQLFRPIVFDSREISPKKVLVFFNNSALTPAVNPISQGKPSSFNIRRKNKNKNFMKAKMKIRGSTLQILVEGKKIDDKAAESLERRQKTAVEPMANLIV